MMRYVKILFFSMVVIGLMAGSAFAGTSRVNHGAANGTPYLAALEAMAAAKNVTIVGVNALGAINAPISYVLGQALTTGNLLELTFTGAAFTGGAVGVCANNTAANGTLIARADTTTAGSSTANFQVDLQAGAGGPNVLAGNYVWFVAGGTNAICHASAAAAANFDVQLSLTSSATTPTARARSLTGGGVEVDTSTAVNLARIVSEFVPTLTAADIITIDYLGTPGTGVQFVPDGGMGTNVLAGGAGNKLSIARTALNSTTSQGAANAGLTTRAIVNLSDSQSWQGVSRVYLMGNNAGTTPVCAIATNVASNTSPSGTVSLTASAAAFNGSTAGGANIGVCIEATAANALSARTITGNQDISVTGTGANDPAAGSNVIFQNWILNAYQAYVPWMVNAATVNTVCLINNNDGARTVNVLFDVVSSEGAVTITGQTLGTIAPRTSKMATFTTDSASFAGDTAVSLSTLGANARYSPKITVTANPDNVTMTCIQIDPTTGGRRAVPVLTNPGLGYKQ